MKYFGMDARVRVEGDQVHIYASLRPGQYPEREVRKFHVTVPFDTFSEDIQKHMLLMPRNLRGPF